MQPHKSFQLVTKRNGRNRDQEYPISNASDFDSSCMTMIGSLQHVDQLEPFKSNRRLFTDWTVKLNNDNQLIVEGTLEWYVHGFHRSFLCPRTDYKMC